MKIIWQDRLHLPKNLILLFTSFDRSGEEKFHSYVTAMFPHYSFCQLVETLKIKLFFGSGISS